MANFGLLRMADKNVRPTKLSLSESKPAMSKRQLIEGIRELNPTAAAPFLAQFDEEALQQYLQHLKAAQLKRVHINGWVRKRSDMRMVS